LRRIALPLAITLGSVSLLAAGPAMAPLLGTAEASAQGYHVIRLLLGTTAYFAAAWLATRLAGVALADGKGKGRRRSPKLLQDLAGAAAFGAAALATIALVFEGSLLGAAATSGVIVAVLGFSLRGVMADVFAGIALGRIVNNRIGLDIWCATATAWNTSVRYYGGHFAHATGVNATLDRFGIRLGNEPGAYTNHNRHVFDAPNFEMRQAGSNIAIPFLNQTSGSAIIARSMRMEACSPLAARHTAGAQDCEYDVAWTNTYLVSIDYTATANRCGNAVINRHRAPASRFQRFLAGVPNTRTAAFRQSATEVGVEGLATISTATTSATSLGDFSFNGLDDVAVTDRAVTLGAQRGLGWMLDVSQVKEVAIAHWLNGNASGGRLFARCFESAGTIRENIAGDVLASITTMVWSAPGKIWTAGASMDDANLNRRQTLRFGPAVAWAQLGIVGFDGPVEVQALRLYGLPEAAPPVLNGTPLLSGPVFGSGRREFAAEVSWDLPSLAPGATSLIDVTVNGARAGDLAQASLVSSTRFIELNAAVWSNNTVRVMARNISAATFDLTAATLSVGVTKRRIP